MTKFNRAIIASAALAGLGMAIFASTAQAAVGQTALGKCYDSVVAACNKKPDHAVNPCVNSGLDQCDEEHAESIQLPGTTIGKLRANALRSVRPVMASTK
jgi:hypothetical protein